MSKILAIIPARGGSKGIPRKNIKLLAGKPLITYAIQAALDSKVIDTVVVSTEDAEIAQIARAYGAKVIDRPQKLAGDTVLTEPVMLHALQVLEQSGHSYSHIALIQCTSPFLSSSIIKRAVSKIGKKFDSCITVFSPDGYEFKWTKQRGDVFSPEHDVEKRPRRQDLSLPYHENGAFYITSTKLFKETLNRFGGRTARVTAIEMSEGDSLQIDAPHHFVVAEAMLQDKNNQFRNNSLKNVKLIISDFDGVFTDNSVISFDTFGKEAVICNKFDSLAIDCLKKTDISLIVVSKESSSVVANRCRKLGIKCYAGVDSKWKLVQKIISEHKCSLENVCYIGNDLNDLECLRNVRHSICPSDAVPEVKKICKYITLAVGGKGVIREVIERICDRGLTNLS